MALKTLKTTLLLLLLSNVNSGFNDSICPSFLSRPFERVVLGRYERTGLLPDNSAAIFDNTIKYYEQKIVPLLNEYNIKNKKYDESYKKALKNSKRSGLSSADSLIYALKLPMLKDAKIQSSNLQLDRLKYLCDQFNNLKTMYPKVSHDTIHKYTSPIVVDKDIRNKQIQNYHKGIARVDSLCSCVKKLYSDFNKK